MAVLPTSGALSINDIAGVMGGTAPHSLSEYYRFGPYTPGLRNITVYEPSSGEYYSVATPVYYFEDTPSAGVVIIWGGSTVASALPSGTTSYTSGGYTYYRGSFQTSGGGSGYVPFYNLYGIYRSYPDVVIINTGVPNIGATTISLSNFYGAEKP